MRLTSLSVFLMRLTHAKAQRFHPNVRINRRGREDFAEPAEEIEMGYYPGTQRIAEHSQLEYLFRNPGLLFSVSGFIDAVQVFIFQLCVSAPRVTAGRDLRRGPG